MTLYLIRGLKGRTDTMCDVCGEVARDTDREQLHDLGNGEHACARCMGRCSQCRDEIVGPPGFVAVCHGCREDAEEVRKEAELANVFRAVLRMHTQRRVAR